MTDVAKTLSAAANAMSSPAMFGGAAPAARSDAGVPPSSAQSSPATANGSPGSAPIAIGRDPLEWVELVPESARRAGRKHRDAAKDAHAPLALVSDERKDRILEKTKIQNRVSHLRSSHVPDDDPTMLEELTKIERLNERIHHLNHREQLLSSTWQRRAALSDNLESYLRYAAQRGLQECPAVIPELKKGESLRQCVDRLHRRQNEKRDDVKRAAAAPYRLADAKAKIDLWLDQLRERAEPNFAPVIDHGELPEFAVTDATTFAAAADRVVHVRAVVVDPLALEAWLRPEQLRQAMYQGLEKVSDDANALSDDERRQIIADGLSEILLLEREEEAAIQLAEEQGHIIDRRSDADPRAVLGLIGPAPENE